jgi:dephospho-CoA kinase
MSLSSSRSVRAVAGTKLTARKGEGVKIVGITGRIGSGKSTLARLLAGRSGCPLIDADELGHDALRGDPRVRAAVLGRFGPGILGPDGAIDRPRIAAIVFADAGALSDLNAIVHPWIIAEILSRLAVLREQGYAGIVLLDAALLLDWTDRLPCDLIVVVRCSQETSIRRLMGRGMTEREARRRLENQGSEDRFLQRADLVVENDATEDELEAQGTRIWQFLNAERKEKNR